MGLCTKRVTMSAAARVTRQQTKATKDATDIAHVRLKWLSRALKAPPIIIWFKGVSCRGAGERFEVESRGVQDEGS
jgi:hypothetical protein